MKKDGGWKNPWVKILACLLVISTILNMTLFTKTRENAVAANNVIGRAMTLIQSADSKLHAAIRILEGESGIVENLYALGEVRTRLTEAQGLLLGINTEASRHLETSMGFRVLPETLRGFNGYLEYEVLAGWREGGDAAVDASREPVLTELRSMKLDLDQLSSLSQDPNHEFYHVKDFVRRWENIMKQRIQENPDTEVHKQISWLYGISNN